MLIHLPKDYTLHIDRPERLRYDKFEGRLLKGAFTKIFQSKENEGSSLSESEELPSWRVL
jgi:hypothetical protein